MRFADEEGLPVMEVKEGFEIGFTKIAQLPGTMARQCDYTQIVE